MGYPLFDSSPTRRSEIEVMEPTTINEARLQMCIQLHRALYGDTWARPQSPAEVWADMLDRIDRARRAFTP